MLNRLCRTISSHKFHLKHVCHHQHVYTISIHRFHYCVSPFTTLQRCCTVTLRNLRKLYPNDVTKSGQLMQDCKLVPIHRNTTTADGAIQAKRSQSTKCSWELLDNLPCRRMCVIYEFRNNEYSSSPTFRHFWVSSRCGRLRTSPPAGHLPPGHSPPDTSRQDISPYQFE